MTTVPGLRIVNALAVTKEAMKEIRALRDKLGFLTILY